MGAETHKIGIPGSSGPQKHPGSCTNGGRSPMSPGVRLRHQGVLVSGRQPQVMAGLP